MSEHMDNGVSVQMRPNLKREDLVSVDHDGNVTVYTHMDTRELLEADVRSEYYGGIAHEAEEIIGWLDRQAAITERELCTKCDWPSIATSPDFGMMARISEQDRRIVELTEERDELLEKLDDAEHTIGGMEDLNAELTAQLDELQAAVDAMGYGQFWAIHREACKERDALRHHKEKVWCDCDCCGWQAERERMQRVIRTQAESFRKLEAELAKGRADDEG